MRGFVQWSLFARPPRVPQHESPPTGRDHTGGGVSGQFTVSYRLLPRCGRTLVVKAPHVPSRQWPKSDLCGYRTGTARRLRESRIAEKIQQLNRNGSAPARHQVGGVPTLLLISAVPQYGLVRLPAKECRNVQLILVAAVMHRRLASVLVQTLRRSTFGIVGDRVGPRFSTWQRASGRPFGRGFGRRRRTSRAWQRFLRLLLATAQTDRGQPLQQ